LNDEVVEIFDNHPWPGNIRQMHNVLRTAVALLGPDEEITAEQLSEDFLEQYKELYCLTGQSLILDSIPASALEPASLDHLEMAAIRRAMEECGGNISAAARRLGISRNTLYRKWKEN
jgi:transcriptional regulator of acetoin/glycerol metabolism